MKREIRSGCFTLDIQFEGLVTEAKLTVFQYKNVALDSILS